jgi:hypothetical protein
MPGSMVGVTEDIDLNILPRGPEGLGISAYQEQNDSLPVPMTPVVLALNYDMGRAHRCFPLASRHFAI